MKTEILSAATEAQLLKMPKPCRSSFIFWMKLFSKYRNRNPVKPHSIDRRVLEQQAVGYPSLAWAYAQSKVLVDHKAKAKVVAKSIWRVKRKNWQSNIIYVDRRGRRAKHHKNNEWICEGQINTCSSWANCSSGGLIIRSPIYCSSEV